MFSIRKPREELKQELFKLLDEVGRTGYEKAWKAAEEYGKLVPRYRRAGYVLTFAWGALWSTIYTLLFFASGVSFVESLVAGIGMAFVIFPYPLIIGMLLWWPHFVQITRKYMLDKAPRLVRVWGRIVDIFADLCSDSDVPLFGDFLVRVCAYRLVEEYVQVRKSSEAQVVAKLFGVSRHAR